MRFVLTKEQEEYRREICEFLTRELTPEVKEKYIDPTQHRGYKPEFVMEFRRRLGETGFIGKGWPKEYGGGGGTLMDHCIFLQEMEYHRAPGIDLGMQYIAPSILMYCTEEQKKYFISGMRKAEIWWWVGYSEPEAGSDLANLQTKAVADGDDFVITGQKAFSTEADLANWGWIAARTDPEAPKHKGISIFAMDMKSPGISITTSKALTGWYHPSVFLDNVRVPKTNLVGELNRAWYQLMGAIDYERTAIGNPGMVLRNFDRLVDYCKETKRNGKPLSKDPAVRHKLATIAVDVEAAKLINYWVVSMQSKGLQPQHQTSISSLYKREAVRLMDYAGVELLGPYMQLTLGSKYVPDLGWFCRDYLDNSFFHYAAGGFDITRNVIAIRGLNLPR